MTPHEHPWLARFEQRLQGLEQRLPTREGRFEEVEEKSSAARAAEEDWEIALVARTDIIFRNRLGDIAKMPIHLARCLKTRESFDGSVEAEGDSIVFRSGGRTIATIPRTLFVCLDRVLERLSLGPGGRGSSPGIPAQVPPPVSPILTAGPASGRKAPGRQGRSS